MKSRLVYGLAIIVAMAIVLVTADRLQATKMDNRIESAAKKSYVFKTYLKDDVIKVQSEGGVVTLTGSVSEDAHKSMAEETVSNLPGVTGVKNLLTVSGEPVTHSSDGWIAQRVRGTLLFHRSVSYGNTKVSVNEGKVTLRGTASSEAQKNLTTEYAQDVSGVKDVDNQMTVTKSLSKKDRTAGEKIDDASVTTQVKMALLFHHNTDVFDTKVSTRKGVVTLSGAARNQAEIDLATKRASDVHGVKKVVNQMTIEASQSSTN